MGWSGARLALQTQVVRVWAMVLALGVGCYQPEFETGVACSEGGRCPGDLVCDLGTFTCELDESDVIDDPDREDVPRRRNQDPDAEPFDFGVSNIDISAIRIASDNWLITSDLTFDTDAPPLGQVVEQTAGGEVVVVYVNRFEVNADVTLKVVGSRPLVVISATWISIDGAIDLSADMDVPGPGGNPECTVGAGSASGPDVYVAGSGGGYGSAGGDGGSQFNDPSPGGAPEGDDSLIPLRGGCPGGNADYNTVLNVSIGGGGGGAIQLVADDSIFIDGSIDASGGGGTTSIEDRSSGAGGGSGGAILLEARDTVEVFGDVVAYGGGGGSFHYSLWGEDGSDGSVSGPGEAGIDDRYDGNGGDGAGESPAGSGLEASTLFGGGGGGGGVGRIRIGAATFDNEGTVVPEPTF